MKKNKAAFTECETLIEAIVSKMSGIKKWRTKFILDSVLLFMSIKGRINFLQLERYGHYSESTYRSNFEKPFDFMAFNQHLIDRICGRERFIAFDPSYLPKSGKKSYGLGKYWSGVAGQAKKGLEIGGIAVIDVENKSAFHLEAVQTPSKAVLESEDKTLVTHYLNLLLNRKDTLENMAKYLVVDGYFAKHDFVKGIVENSQLQIISKLRDDADCLYLYQGEKTGKKGRPKRYDGKVNWKNIDKSHFQLIEDMQEYRLFTAIVYSRSLKRKIKVVYTQFLDEMGKVVRYKIFFSTALEAQASLIFEYYRLRFHIEFLFRDAKQFTGLTHCQAISQNKIYFHTNMALTTVSIAKALYWMSIPKQERNAFSMADIKTLYFNNLLMNRIFQVFDFRPNFEENKQQLDTIRKFGTIAA